VFSLVQQRLNILLLLVAVAVLEMPEAEAVLANILLGL